MPEKRNRYQQMEWLMTFVLVAAVGLFLLYLVFAAFGITWLKVVLAILTTFICLSCLAFLYLSRELLKQRSLWMTAAAGAVLICLIFSLLLNFPRPNPYKNTVPVDSGTSNSQSE